MPPTVVFVAGAWHSPLSFGLVAHKLQQAGYQTRYICLPSVGPETHLENMTPDIEKIRGTLSTLIEAGHHIILIMHSYGGIPGSAAVQGLNTAYRENSGLKGGVDHLLYVSSFLLPPGISLLDAAGGKPKSWWSISDDQKSVFPATPIELFYNDMPEDEAEAAARTLKPLSYGCLTSKATYAAWTDVSTTYVLCEKDQAIPIEAQKAMVEKAKEGCKKTFKTETLNSGHSPFYSQPDALVRAIRRAAGEGI